MQDLYLGSLTALGIIPAEHDIRFVEDDWEGPTLGAWGLGWEVWMDGMEITQFTYFQQAGGIDLRPDLGRVDLRPGAHRDVPAGRGFGLRPGVGTRGQLRRHLPRERAAVEPLQLRGRRYRGRCSGGSPSTRPSAPAASTRGWCLPAYDQVLKCSHSFNLLDARGVISPTERGAYIWRVRALAARVAAAYLAQREPAAEVASA